MEKILITGGNGYIGTYLAKYFKEQGYEIIITSRKSINDSRYETRTMDLLKESTIAGICKDVDIVIHTATMDERFIIGNEKDTFLANAYGTRLLYVDAIKHNVKKFIYFSTFHVYGKNSGIIDESVEPTPISDYGLSHYFAEQYLKQLGKNSTCKTFVLRLTNGVGVPFKGCDKWYLVLNDFCKTVFEKEEIVMKSNGLALRDFVAIEDIVKAVMCLITSGIDEEIGFHIYNISSEMTYSIKDIAYMVAQLYEKRYHKEVILNCPKATKEEQEKVEPLKVASEKIRKLGWKNSVSIENVINSIFIYLETYKEVE